MKKLHLIPVLLLTFIHQPFSFAIHLDPVFKKSFPRVVTDFSFNCNFRYGCIYSTFLFQQPNAFLSADGKTVLKAHVDAASYSGDYNGIDVYDVDSGNLIQNIMPNFDAHTAQTPLISRGPTNDEFIWSTCHSRDGLFYCDNLIQIYNYKTGQATSSLIDVDDNDPYEWHYFTQSGKLIATIDGQYEIKNLVGSDPTRTFGRTKCAATTPQNEPCFKPILAPFESGIDPITTTHETRYALFSPDESLLLSLSSNDHPSRLFSSSMLPIVRQTAFDHPIQQDLDPISSSEYAEFSSDSKYIVFCKEDIDNYCSLWKKDGATYKIAVERFHDYPKGPWEYDPRPKETMVHSVGFTPSGKHIVIGSAKIHFYDLSGKLVAEFGASEPQRSYFNEVNFSKDGSRIFSRSVEIDGEGKTKADFYEVWNFSENI